MATFIWFWGPKMKINLDYKQLNDTLKQKSVSSDGHLLH